jgi:glycosyltransferase involved in cell wall biosynthesis
VELKPKNTVDLWKQLKSYQDFDIIHSHDIFALPGLTNEKNRNSKIVYTHHGVVPLRYSSLRDYPAGIFGIWCGHYGIPKIDMAVAISNYMANDLKKRFKCSKIINIPNGIDFDSIRIQKKETNEDDINIEGDPKLLNVSVLEPQKGLDFLIKSMPTIQKQLPEASLTIIGSGRYENKLRNYIKDLNLTDSVKITGYLQDSLLYQYYNHSDIIIIPSYIESFSLPIIEAMSFGKPVVARSASAMSEHLLNSRGGELFNSNDPLELSEAIKNVLNNYEQYSTSAKKYAINFDIKKIAAKHNDLYNKLLQKA